MERDTTKLSIGKHTFTVKTYVNAKELNTIQKTYFQGSKVEIVGQEPKFSEFNPNVQYEVKLEMIRQLVVEMDGSKEQIVARCEELPAGIFDELAVELDTIASKKKS
jgi:hypothetical protein